MYGSGTNRNCWRRSAPCWNTSATPWSPDIIDQPRTSWAEKSTFRSIVPLSDIKRRLINLPSSDLLGICWRFHVGLNIDAQLSMPMMQVSALPDLHTALSFTDSSGDYIKSVTLHRVNIFPFGNLGRYRFEWPLACHPTAISGFSRSAFSDFSHLARWFSLHILYVGLFPV